MCQVFIFIFVAKQLSSSSADFCITVETTWIVVGLKGVSNIFFFLNCFWWTRGPFFVFILLCRPSEDSLQWSTIPDGSPAKDWQSTVGWGDCRIQTRDCRFTVGNFPKCLCSMLNFAKRVCNTLCEQPIGSPTISKCICLQSLHNQAFPVHFL